MKSEHPTVSIVVASARIESLRLLLESIDKHTQGMDYEIVVVTSSLPTKTLDALEKYRVFWVWEQEKRGCVRSFVQGFRAAHGKYVAHINDDCLVTENWLKNALAAIGNRDVLGAFYIKEPDTDGFVVNTVFGKLYANMGLVKRVLFEKLGGWDESFVHYGADPDFALKCWHAGYEVIPMPNARIIHHCNKDEVRREDLRAPAWEKLVSKWRGIYC